MKLRTVLAACAAFAAANGPAMAENRSEYTKLDLDNGCVAISEYEAGGSWSCEGYKGYGILFSEGDLRQSVFYGYVGEWYAEGAFESFGGFNNVSGTIEWRLDGDTPVAAIQRWFIDNPEETGEQTDETRGQVLVVAKVAQPGVGDGCVVGYVDARENTQANELARQIADEMAPGFRCRVDQPEYHGEQGLLAGEPMRTFGP